MQYFSADNAKLLSLVFRRELGILDLQDCFGPIRSADESLAPVPCHLLPPKLQSWKKWLTYLSGLGERITPFSNARLIQVILSEGLLDSPTPTDKEGKKFERKSLLSVEQYHALILFQK